jgi:hypothetical protein
VSYIHDLCLLVYSGVQHILCCVFCFVCLRLVTCYQYLIRANCNDSIDKTKILTILSVISK